MWALFAILAAFSNTAANLLKKVGSRSTNEIVLSWALHVLAVPIAFVILLTDNSTQQLTSTFYITALTAGILTSLTSVLIIRSMRHTDLSYVVPYFTFLPVFLLLSSYLMLGERPTERGIIGILLIVFGAYYLNSHKHQKILDPFRYLLRNRGARYILLVTIIWSFTTNLDKIATRDVSPQLLVVAIMMVQAVTLSIPVALWHRKDVKRTVKRHQNLIVWLALFVVLTLLFQTLSIQSQFVSYALAIKRFDVLLSIIAAGIILKEKDTLKRIEGAIPMVLGAILIGFS